VLAHPYGNILNDSPHVATGAPIRTRKQPRAISNKDAEVSGPIFYFGRDWDLIAYAFAAMHC